jgi:hypothetical protein
MTVKESFNVVGLSTTFGNPLWKETSIAEPAVSSSPLTRRWRERDSNPLPVARTPGFLRLSSPSGGSKWTPYWITFGRPPTRINRQPAERIQFEVRCPL